jgi:hypothetical protein
MRGVARSVQLVNKVCKCSQDSSRGLLSDEYNSLEAALVFWKMGGGWTGRKESEEGQAEY